MMKIIQSVNHVTQWLAVRLYTRGSSRADRQRGASALEYIVLAAVIVAILIAIGATGFGDKLKEAFENLVPTVTDPGTVTAPAS